MKTPNTQKPSISKLKKRADTYFSKAIRLRDTSNGYGPCITCDKELPITSLHAGHFQSRRHSATRYDDENVNAQCAGCNTFRGGEQYKYGIALDNKYGAGTAKRLAQKAQEYHKFTIDELEQIIQDAKEEIRFYEQ